MELLCIEDIMFFILIAFIYIILIISVVILMLISGLTGKVITKADVKKMAVKTCITK